ncbi:MAG: UDP-2,4-diacetamido-2,4,6-trideoxy-beta-L-altropyranose hydrolase [Candidatus Peribacteraceae bacterium]|nr:UDP-2,4-diacetamido-2,4,6-trideoxy-beta-L-altropyranose hydrolase [Candidatus Peribacteraceae bacterium]
MSTIVFRTDASAEIGTGHAMRCLALAQAAHDAGHRTFFLMIPGAEQLKIRLRAEGCDVRELSAKRGSPEDARETAALCKEYSAHAVVDGYAFNDAYQQILREENIFVLLIDDYGQAQTYAANIILNQNSYAPNLRHLYKKRPDGSKLLLGSEYILLRREFCSLKPAPNIPATVKNILVTFGGSDVQNMTVRAVASLRSSVNSARITVVVGSANTHAATIEAAGKGMTVVRDTKNMPELMANSDLALAAAGTTSYELAYMGVPMLLCALAENQRPVAKNLEKQGIAHVLKEKDLENPDAIAQIVRTLSQDQMLRRQMSEKGRALVDGGGARRVLEKLLQY